MKLFACQNCGHSLYFENVRCERCGHALGYLPENRVLSALEPDCGDRWRPMATPGDAWRYCGNAQHGACNWMVPADSPDAFCQACQLNHMIPDLSAPQNLELWRKLEQAKRRLVYTLTRLRLPLPNKAEDPQAGLAFDFLSAEGSTPGGGPVMTGHDNGLITLNLAEADPAQREQNRLNLHENYRTLLGHFRHEVGHYYWDRLVRDGGELEAFRAMFGDEQADYAQALQIHYDNGPAPGWEQTHVSAYATAHPWEDFAETWAHYLHMVDTLETAAAFGVRTAPQAARDPGMASRIDFDPYRQRDFDALMDAWLPLTYAVNSLNQSMGQPQLYPFVLAPAVVDKLRFVHRLIKTDDPAVQADARRQPFWRRWRAA